MDELLKALRHFIVRDLVFLIAGATVVAAFLHRFDHLPGSNSSFVLFVLLAAFAYVIGYAVQDLAALTPLLTTMPVDKPNRFVKWLYKRYTGLTWKDIGNVELEPAPSRIKDERDLAQWERIVTLQQVGTAVGPCLAISSGLLFWKWALDSAEFDLALAVASLVLALVLVALAWLKAAQHARFLASLGSFRGAA